jgi:alpha-glucuronidase
MNKSRIGDLDRIILEGVTIPEVGGFEIKADTLTKDGAQSRSKTYTESA